MIQFSGEAMVAALAIIGIVIVVSALLSGLIEKSGLPQIAVFIGIGAALGPAGLGVLNVTLDSPLLRIVATLSLTLVLFTDAVSLNMAEIRRHGTLALRLLVPGTLLCAALMGLAGWWLLGLSAPAAAILGAALASTDPVLLRSLLRRRDIPVTARQALQLESGLNDVVLLPVIIVAMAILGHPGLPNAVSWARLGLNLFILGPGAGIAVGLLAVAALDLIRKQFGVRRDYESLYSLGVAFTAFAAAETVHGSGFLAAFAAGLTIATLDVELCDCFIEYGGVTAEMMLLFTFVIFGTSLIWTGFTVISTAALLFAAVVILVRTPVYLLSLIGARMDRRGRLLIAWFGPRGLSSLLLILLPVFAGLPNSEFLFSICCLTVLLSIVLHGGSPMLLARIARHRAQMDSGGSTVPQVDGTEAGFIQQQALSHDGHPPEATDRRTPSIEQTVRDPDPVEPSESDRRPSTPSAQPGQTVQTTDSERISVEELLRLQQYGEPVLVLDVRTDRTFDPSDSQAAGAIRLPPDDAVAQALKLGLPKDTWLIAYCA